MSCRAKLWKHEYLKWLLRCYVGWLLVGEFLLLNVCINLGSWTEVEYSGVHLADVSLFLISFVSDLV